MSYYKCEFCGALFKSETRFFKHNCKEMKRHASFKTIIGQSAWAFYKDWLKCKRRSVHNADSFINSKLYDTFITFTKFTRKTQLPNTTKFIKLMVSDNIQPALWSTTEVYGKYLVYIDHKFSAMEQANITVDTLFKISEAAECEISEVFEILTPEEVIQLCRQRRFSPWLLLNSITFKTFYTTALNPDQRIILESIIKPAVWGKKFKRQPKDVDNMRAFVKELGL